MSIFEKPEVIILKETSDAKLYLGKLQELRKTISDDTKTADKIDREIAITEAGIYGEDSILFELKNSGMNLVVIHDLYIKTEDGRGAQIDYWVITPYANVLIECKNLVGDIEINSRGEFIRTFEYKGKKNKEGIYSPITQNERHLTVYKDCKKNDQNFAMKLMIDKYFDRYHKSIVVLANPKTVINDRYAKKEIRDQVIRCDQLVGYLKSLKTDLKNNKKETLQSGEKILSMNIEDRKEYMIKFEKLLEETKSLSNNKESNETEADNTMICPSCGGKLILRTAKKGPNEGNQFYGCSNYPNCKFIKNLT